MARKHLVDLDLAKNQLLNARIQNLAADPSTPVVGQEYFNTTTNKLRTYNGATWDEYGTSTAAGTVTTVSVVSANGLGGTVATPSSTPAITLSTSVTGIIKGNGTALSAATAGTDYLAPAGSGAALTGITESQVVNLPSDLSAKAPLASPTFTGTVTVPATVNATDAAQKAYVDSVAQGLSAKASVLAMATTNLALTGVQTVDGVSLVATNRVLLTGQTTASQNGVWVVQSGAWTRPTDFSTGSIQVGTYVFVEGGTANASSGWIENGTTSVTVDTTSQTWTQFSGAGEIIAGTGLTKSGNTLAVTANTSHKFAATIGDGSTTAIAVTHSLGTQDVIAQIRDATTNAVVDCDIVMTSTTVTTFTFAVAPATNAYRVVIEG
jgi:hypothetical protein